MLQKGCFGRVSYIALPCLFRRTWANANDPLLPTELLDRSINVTEPFDTKPSARSLTPASPKLFPSKSICFRMRVDANAFSHALADPAPNSLLACSALFYTAPSVWATFSICYGIFIEEHTCEAILPPVKRKCGNRIK